MSPIFEHTPRQYWSSEQIVAMRGLSLLEKRHADLRGLLVECRHPFAPCRESGAGDQAICEIGFAFLE